MHFLIGITAMFQMADGQSEQEIMYGSQFVLDEIVVVGDRAEGVLHKSTTATSVLTASDLSTIPTKNLAEALNYLTGIAFINQDASGNMPVAIIRGFYGGGEAEYLLLNVDGIPVNDLSSGLINWNLIPVEEIKRIEITRGGGSAVYGDMAIGGVINVITQSSDSENKLNLNLTGGQFENKGISVNQSFHLDNHGFQLTGNLLQKGGYRDHSALENNTFSATYKNSLSKGNFRLKADYSRLKQDEAGPLTEELLKENRRQSSSLFSEDNRLRDQLDFAASFLSSEDQHNQYSIRAGLRSYAQAMTRTLQLTSQLGDSQFEDQDNRVLWTQFQYRQELEQTKLIIGAETELGIFNSKYYDLEKTNLLSQGEGARSKLGFYVEGKYAFNERLGATLGSHFSIIENSGKVNNRMGSAIMIPEDEVKINRVSPRLGFNYQYHGVTFFEGNIFANWSKAFKAPSLDQLYDTRIINFFGQEFNYSNTTLVPQESTNFDVGLYQKFGFPASAFSGEVSLVVYNLDIRNEIDFDMSTFKYGNIKKSRHSGFEGSLGVYFANRIRLNSTLNIMDVTFSTGDYEGNRLKNIPRTSYTNRFTFRINSYLNIILAHRFLGEVFLDDANSVSLPAYNAIDGRMQLRLNQIRIDLDVFNLMGTHYSSSGYMLFDPFLQDNVKFLYPAQGRYIELSFGYTL
ncbi:MAG: TonB-dependent receptor [Candidatus Neomarinimicrobiota bacterium]|nr:TonB-dependent receptor [Candidatus Neomarinimicrobiota bacterium]